MTKLTPQETVKAVLDALHNSSADFVVQILSCKFWARRAATIFAADGTADCKS